VKVAVYSPDGNTAVISVKDEGQGIDHSHQEKIFEQFYRLESSRDRLSGGVGLGLPLARALAKCQGIVLKLVSELGRGTEVQLILQRVET
jgi:signal transduction histidine kinase